MAVSEKRRHAVVPVDEIPEGDGVLAEIGDREIGIFKSKGKLYAYENRCIHLGGPVCSGVLLGKTNWVLNEIGEVLAEVDDEDDIRLVCPWHGWEYDITTGEVAHDRRFRLRRFDVSVVDGVVHVEL